VGVDRTVPMFKTLQLGAARQRVAIVPRGTGTHGCVAARPTEGVHAAGAVSAVVKDGGRDWFSLLFLASITECPQFKAAFTRAAGLMVNCSASLVSTANVCPAHNFTFEVSVAALVFGAVCVPFTLPPATVNGVRVGYKAGHTPTLSHVVVSLRTHRIGPTWTREARIARRCGSYFGDTWSPNRRSGGWGQGG